MSAKKARLAPVAAPKLCSKIYECLFYMPRAEISKFLPEGPGGSPPQRGTHSRPTIVHLRFGVAVA
jgi:hypothetical protein